MLLADKLPGSLPELTDSIGIVLDGLLQSIMFLHKILGRELILAAVFDHHVQLLFAHPGFCFARVEEELKTNVELPLHCSI